VCDSVVGEGVNLCVFVFVCVFTYASFSDVS